MSDAARHGALLRFAGRNLLRRWHRSLAIGVPLAVAMAVATTATLVVDGIRRDAALAAAAIPDMALQRIDQGRLVPIEVAPIEAALRGTGLVAEVRQRVFTLLPAPGEESGGALATLVGVDWSVGGAAVVGRVPEPGERGVVVLGQGVASERHVALGEPWNIVTPRGLHPLTVVGLLSDGVAVHGANLALTSIEDARAIAGVPDTHATELAVTLVAGADPMAVAEDVTARFPRLRVIGRSAVARILDAVYGGRSGAFVTIWLILLLVAPAVAWALGLDVAASERHEMGVLKALGWSTLHLVEARMLEAGLLGMLATLSGALVGTILALMGAPGIAGLFLGWTEIYPAFPPPLALEPASALALLALGVVPLLAAGAIPAWRVGSTSPDAVMRD